MSNVTVLNTKQKDGSMNDLSITDYMHCKKCLDELPAGTSPQEFSWTQTGFTKQGIQVWCNRHNCNVVHIDFEGQRHPAIITTKQEKE